MGRMSGSATGVRENRRRVRRIAVILLAGSTWALAIISYQIARRPKAAPDDVQESGKRIVLAELAKLEASGEGQSVRWKVIIAEARRLLAADQIVFAPMANGRGLTWDPWFESKTVFVKVLEMNHDRYLHQLGWQVAEVIAHESLHSAKDSFAILSASIEEECDAFAAGAEAQAISQGRVPDVVLKMDGVPIADFVKTSYRWARHDLNYEPVGESIVWLNQRTGL
jgi:hypothetical protein